MLSPMSVFLYIYLYMNEICICGHLFLFIFYFFYKSWLQIGPRLQFFSTLVLKYELTHSGLFSPYLPGVSCSQRRCSSFWSGHPRSSHLYRCKTCPVFYICSKLSMFPTRLFPLRNSKHTGWWRWWCQTSCWVTSTTTLADLLCQMLVL